MKTNKVLSAIILSAALLVTCLPGTALAHTGDMPATGGGGEVSTPAPQDMPNSVGFYVSAELPDNQVNPEVSYFDLRVQPGGRQDLRVRITNEGSQDITLKVAANTASTNLNGVIDYRTPDIRHEALDFGFADITEVKEPEVHVKAGQTGYAVVSLALPEQAFDGMLLGGILVTRELDKNEIRQGVNLQNEYSYVIGVKLTESDEETFADFEPIGAGAELINRHTKVVHNIRNTEPAVIKDVALAIEIYPANNKNRLLLREERMIDVAPSSVVPYACSWKDGEIQPGNYLSVVHLEKEGREWDFEMPFTVTAAQAGDINSNTLDEAPQQDSFWMILAIVLAAAVVVCVLLMLYMANKRKKARAQAGEGPTEPGSR